MYLENINVLNEVNFISITVRIVLALIIGGIIGMEREQKHRPAGFRTYTIVCIGSAIAALTNVYLVHIYGGGDVARIPAQVISGIGFLGAGTILVTRNNHVKGLTTAAGLWCAATIGIAIGTGFYTGAIIGAIAIMISLKFLSYVDSKFTKKSKYITLYVEYTDSLFIRKLITYTKQNNILLKDLEMNNMLDSHSMYATFILQLPEASGKMAVLEYINSIDGLLYSEEM